jgi:uncharacterized protein (DUF58 family)
VLTRRGWSLLGASFGLLAAGRLLGTVELAALSVAGFGLILFGMWWTRRQPARVDIDRHVRPARMHVDDDGRVDLALTNVGTRQTTVLAVTDTFQDGRRAARFLVAPLPPGQTGRGAYRVPTTRRGRFALGPLTVALTDAFGLVRRSWPVGEIDEVVVAPRVHDVVGLGDVSGSPLRIVSRGPTRILPSDVGDEFLTLREYEVGDDLRRVHWRSTAHTDDLMVRQEEAQRRPEITIVLDTRSSAYDSASFEIAVEAVASVATAMVRIGRRVDVLTASGLRLATASPRDLVMLMDQLAVIDREPIDRLGGVVEGFGSRRPTGALVAITGRFDPATADAFRQAASGFGVTIMVGTRAGGSVGAPGRGARSFLTVDASSQPFPTAWNRTILQWHLAATPRHSLSRS